nr:hypothetical protein Itr_chr10CG06700 [Ipomoea trifida]
MPFPSREMVRLPQPSAESTRRRHNRRSLRGQSADELFKEVFQFHHSQILSNHLQGPSCSQNGRAGHRFAQALNFPNNKVERHCVILIDYPRSFQEIPWLPRRRRNGGHRGRRSGLKRGRRSRGLRRVWYVCRGIDSGGGGGELPRLLKEFLVKQDGFFSGSCGDRCKVYAMPKLQW